MSEKRTIVGQSGEAFGPGGHSGVAGDDHAAPQVALGDHLEQGGLAILVVETPVAKFVDDQQLGSDEDRYRS